MIGIRCGFRISEILSLTRESITENSIKVEKKNIKGKSAGRTMPMHSDIARALLRHKSHGDKLFQVRRETFYRNIRSAAKRAGIDSDRIGTHSMRKTFAKKAYDLVGRDAFALKKAMGHSNIATTNKYIEVDEKELWDALKRAK